MLHELILALNGHPGGVFIKSANEDIHVVTGLPFLHPTEEALLNRLCRLATHYCHFQNFIRQYGNAPFSSVSGGNLHGIYGRAVCAGLDHVLDPYRKDLLKLEEELLTDKNLTPAHIQTSLEQYQLLFPALLAALTQILQQKAHGGLLLEILHRASQCGMVHVRAAFTKMMFSCHSVFYKQLSAWLLHGMLQDKYAEFFIQPAASKTPSSASSIETEDDLALSATTQKQIHHLLAMSKSGEVRSDDFQFCLNAEMLPSYIPPRVAQKILFVGESVAMFERNRKSSSSIYTGGQQQNGSILGERCDEYAQELLALSKQPEFNLMQFDATIDRIRTYVAEALWVLVVEQAGLLSQLRCVKDFYLIGRGELFQAFIDQAHSLLQPPPSTQHTSSTEYDVNVAFQCAARKVMVEDESLMQKFTLTITLPDTKASQAGKGADAGVESGWNCLGMKGSVDWPLHILFTPGVLSRYNSLFRFLLFVRRSQAALQQCWATGMAGSKKHHAPQVGKRWWLRTHMAFLVDNLQYYLQVDVIESQFSILAEKIEKTRDFETIRIAHDQFITSLLTHCFLLTKPISHCLKELLELCNKFCVLLQGQNEQTLTEQQQKQLETIAKDFQRQTSLLFMLLSSMRNHAASPHIAQLLLRIDYNKYFSTSRGQLTNFEATSQTTQSSLHREA